jgi:hypothetical protein
MKNSAIYLFKFLTVLIMIQAGNLMLSESSKAQTILNNDRLRFGNGTENSVNATGNLQQPFYYNSIYVLWRKLTYSGYPLDNAYGINGDKTNEWNTNGNIVENPVISNQVIDSSGFIRTGSYAGYGTIISTGDITINGTQLEIENKYTLPAGKAYIKVEVKVTNLSGGTVENVRVWIGTRDDYVGGTDVPNKQKGNLADGAFAMISDAATRSSALKIATADEGILFYTNSDKGNTIVQSCCSWNYVIYQDPSTAQYNVTSDGSYGFYVRFNDLTPGQSDNFAWYYAAGELADLEDIIKDVSEASGAVSNITDTTATFTAKTSVDGKGYWMVVPRDVIAPVAEEIKAGINYGIVTVVASDSGDMTANVDTEFSLTGLTAATDYDLYFVSQDATLAFSSIVKAQFTMLKIDQVIDFAALITKTYGDDASAVSATGGASGNPVTFTSSDPAVATCTGTNGETITVLKAGSTEITANQAGNITYNAAAPVGHTLIVNPKAITVTADTSQSKVYTETDPEFTYTVNPALKEGDNISGALSRDAGEIVGNYSMVIGTLIAGSNYTVTFETANFEIVPKTITVTADEGQSKFPGEADTVLTYTYDPELESGDSLTGVLSREAGEGVGTYAITLGDLSANSNYNITLVSNIFRILVFGDTNRNGVIDEGEIAGDVDGNGTIGEGELAGDLNGNGTIGEGEIAGDINGDGAIGTGELAGDINGDGAIGTGELAGDINGDGALGTGELAGDLNGNGTIGTGEIAGDLNGNGTIGEGEIAGDINGNGTIGEGEIAGDLNGNGTIGTGELAGDISGDGTIGTGEITGDISGDGTIGEGEVQGDKNGNGILDGDEITGIVKNLTSAVIKLFPNPVNDYLQVEMPDETFDVNIFDAKGALLLSRKDCSSSVRIDLPAKVKGQLVVKVNTGNISHSAQVIVK